MPQGVHVCCAHDFSWAVRLQHHSMHVVVETMLRGVWLFTLPVPGTSAGTAVIDLHGQHIGEALKLLRREVARLRGTALHKGDSAVTAAPAAQREPRARAVRILVGTNSHSKARAASLPSCGHAQPGAILARFWRVQESSEGFMKSSVSWACCDQAPSSAQ